MNQEDNRNLFLQGILNFKNGNFYDAISNFLEVYENDNQNKDCILYLGKAKLALKDINRFPVCESNDLITVSEDINPATKRNDNNS